MSTNTDKREPKVISVAAPADRVAIPGRPIRWR